MIPLYHETHFTFRFADDRIIPRFHLEGVEFGRRIRVFTIDPVTVRSLDVTRQWMKQSFDFRYQGSASRTAKPSGAW